MPDDLFPLISPEMLRLAQLAHARALETVGARTNRELLARLGIAESFSAGSPDEAVIAIVTGFVTAGIYPEWVFYGTGPMMIPPEVELTETAVQEIVRNSMLLTGASSGRLIQ